MMPYNSLSWEISHLALSKVTLEKDVFLNFDFEKESRTVNLCNATIQICIINNDIFVTNLKKDQHRLKVPPQVLFEFWGRVNSAQATIHIIHKQSERTVSRPPLGGANVSKWFAGAHLLQRDNQLLTPEKEKWRIHCRYSSLPVSNLMTQYDMKWILSLIRSLNDLQVGLA